MKLRLKPTLFFFSLVMTSLILAVCFPMLVHAAPPVVAHTPPGIRGEIRTIRGEDRESTPPVAVPPVAVHTPQGIRARTKSIRGKVKSVRGEAKSMRDEDKKAARKAPQAVHLAYLQCYPLGETAKKACQDKINPPVLKTLSPQSRKTFIYEAERLGFARFLRQHRKICARIDEGPRFDKEHKAYVVQCIKAAPPIAAPGIRGANKEAMPPSTYLMRFDGGAWRLLD